MNKQLAALSQQLAGALSLPGGGELIETLKLTAFKEKVTDAQMTALLIICNQYKLNPWTKEIYAFPDKNNGIVPVVGVDGWSRIINSHPQFDGMEFEMNAEDKSCTCTIWRKDRAHPIKATEYMEECYRRDTKNGGGLGAWGSHPRRMLRHKTMIQCARLAFGYVGIYDPDEAQRIIEASADKNSYRPAPAINIKPDYPQTKLESHLSEWQSAVSAGKPAQNIIGMIESKYRLTDTQKAQIHALAQAPEITEIEQEAVEVIEGEANHETD